MRRVVASSDHRIPTRPPLHVAVGERVSVGKRDTHWPAFAFVTSADGEGWVPIRYLSAVAGEALVVTAYDTTELPTEAGDVLEVVEEDAVGGWLRCRTSDGREGWVPAETVEPG